MTQQSSEPESNKVPLDLMGVDGNAFALLAAFRKAARESGWPEHEINAVLGEATSGNYHHLVATLQAHCE